MSLRDYFSLPDDEHTTVICTLCKEPATVAVFSIEMRSGMSPRGPRKAALSECCLAPCVDELATIYQVEDLYVGDGPITGFPGR
jgi:hypothetical protein